MPYYKEQFSDGGYPWLRQNFSSDFGSVTSSTSGEHVLRDTVMTSFRTRPKSAHFEEVTDIQADPYAYFLEDISKRSWDENLIARGYTPSDHSRPDRGHTLHLQNYTAYGQLLSGRMRSGSGWWNYQFGGYNNVLPDTDSTLLNSGPFTGGVAVPATFPVSALEAFAQRAFARSAPTYEQFNLARSLGELKQLPRVKVDTISKTIGEWRFQGDKWIQKGANRLGDDTLNIMFGWAPLVSDVIALCKALVEITNGLIQEPVVAEPKHRTFQGPREEQSSDYSATSYTGVGRSNTILTDPKLIRPGAGYAVFSMNPVSWTATKRLTRTQWFEGSFTKFLPLGFDAKNYLDRADALLNLDLDVLTLWNLTPWTWLSDWAVDISSTIAANQAASDKSLIAHYAYAMEKTTASVFLDYRVVTNDDYYQWIPGSPLSGSHVTETTWKRRIRANPYGFVPGGPSGLNPFRTAVLAALGLSRL